MRVKPPRKLMKQEDKLFVIDSQTKIKREILSLEPQLIFSPVATPDNTRLVFSVATIEGDIQRLSCNASIKS